MEVILKVEKELHCESERKIRINKQNNQKII